MSFVSKFDICDNFIFENSDKWKTKSLAEIQVGTLRKENGYESKVSLEGFEMDSEQVGHFLVRMRVEWGDNYQKLLGLHDKIEIAASSLSDSWQWEHTVKKIEESRKISGWIQSINDVLKTKLLNLPASTQDDIKNMAKFIYSPVQTLRSIEDIYEGILENCIYQTVDWDKKKELMPLIIEILLEKSQEEGKLVSSKEGWNALYLAAVIGDVSVIEKLRKILGNELQNAINQGNKLPLNMAIVMGQYTFAKALIDAGADVNSRNDTFQPILHDILLSSDLKAIEFCLNLEGIDLDCKDEYKNTALHIACHLSDPKVVELLMKNPTLAKQSNAKDVFGRTPLDVALQNKSDEIIGVLLQDKTVNPKALPGYGQELQKIGQNTALNNLSKYLYFKKNQDEQKLELDKPHLSDEEIAERKKMIRDPSVLPSGGHCNGLSFLFQYYASKGKEQEFYHILDLFSRWDGTEAGLKSRKGLENLSTYYKDLEDLMEQWINDIIWFQHDSLKPSYLPYGQLGRTSQFEAIKKQPSDNLKNVKKTYYKFSKEQLADWLRIQSHFPGNVVEISGSRHTVSLRVLGNGYFLYYDPNIPHPLPPFRSADALAEIIQQIKFLSIGEGKDKMSTIALIYKYLDENNINNKDSLGKVPEDLLNTKSSNGYSRLHLAILFNDQALFNTELNSRDAKINTPNVHGQTPLYDAILYGRKEMVDALMRQSEFDLSKNLEAGDLLRIALQMGHFDIAKSLLDKGYEINDEHISAVIESKQNELLQEILAKKADPRFVNSYSFTLNGRPLHIAINRRDSKLFELLLKYGADPKGNGFFGTGSILSCIADVREESFLHSIIPMLPNNNDLDEEGFNLLHYAVLKNNAWLVKYLMESGVDLSVKDRNGKTALELSKDKQNESLYALLLQKV